MSVFDVKANRRQIVTTLGVAIGALFGSSARRGDAKLRGLVPRPNVDDRAMAIARSGSDVASLFGDLAPGALVGGHTIVSVHAPVGGAIPVVLRTAEGKTFQLDVLRRSEGTSASSIPGTSPRLAGADSHFDDERSVATSKHFAVSVCNGGDGGHATDEEQAHAAIALADVLARNEARGARPPSSLLTLREREARFRGDVLRLRV